MSLLAELLNIKTTLDEATAFGAGWKLIPQGGSPDYKEYAHKDGRSIRVYKKSKGMIHNGMSRGETQSFQNLMYKKGSNDKWQTWGEVPGGVTQQTLTRIFRESIIDEDAETASRLARGEMAPKGVMAKLDHWLGKAMFTKDKNRFIPALRAEAALRSYGFNDDQVHWIREAAAEAAQTAIKTMQTKYGEQVPDKYVGTVESNFQVFDLYLNVGGEMQDKFAELMRQLFDAKLKKLGDKLTIIKEDADLQALGKGLVGGAAPKKSTIQANIEDEPKKTAVNTPPAEKAAADAEEVEGETPAEFKVGDKVKPKVGPHKGQLHNVIHVFPDGRINLTPVGLKGAQIKYRQGAVTATADQVDLAESVSIPEGSSLLSSFSLMENTADRNGFMPIGYGPKKGHKIEAYGRKGMKNQMWRKMFKSEQEMNKWCDDNDATVEGTRMLGSDEKR